jgi:hypothetical protein
MTSNATKLEIFWGDPFGNKELSTLAFHNYGASLALNKILVHVNLNIRTGPMGSTEPRRCSFKTKVCCN